MTTMNPMTPGEALGVVIDATRHDESCILAKWEAGRPTESGGYETKIRGVWYQRSPIDETPKCECRIVEALAVLDGLHAHFSRFKVGDEVWIISQETRQSDDYETWYGDWWCPKKPAHVQRIVFGQIAKDEARITIDAGDDIERSWTESDCFPTEESALAECKHRNEASK